MALMLPVSSGRRGLACCRQCVATSSFRKTCSSAHMNGAPRHMTDLNPCHSYKIRRVHGLHRLRRSRGELQVARAIFGVGAPEALLVGVVALVVFGPKGLIEAARGAAGVLKSFTPTIQELNQVTSELRTNMSKEMGLNELQQDFRDLQQATRSHLSWDRPPIAPPPPSSTTATKPAADTEKKEAGKGPKEKGPDCVGAKEAGTSTSGLDSEERRALSQISQSLAAMDERQAASVAAGLAGTEAAGMTAMTAEQALQEDPDIERKRRESAALAWKGNVPRELSVSDTNGAVGGAGVEGKMKRLEDMTLAELEAELAKRQELIDRIRVTNADAAQKQV